MEHKTVTATVDDSQLQQTAPTKHTPPPVHLLIGVSGSVATIKLEVLLDQFLACQKPEYEVRVVLTDRARTFLDLSALVNKYALCARFQGFYQDADEWGKWKKKGDPVLHIDLRRWADVFVIAPLSANTLAKISNGLCDNLLTCVARAWDFSPPLTAMPRHFDMPPPGAPKRELKLHRPFIVAPAMNTMMFNHPITKQQLDTLAAWGIIVLDTVVKELACQEVGAGAMAEPTTIFDVVDRVSALILLPTTTKQE